MSMWTRYFGKDPKELFLAYSPHEFNWRVVSWNYDLMNPDQRLWVIEAHNGEKISIEWSKHKHEDVKFFKGPELIRKRRIPPTDYELRVLMNLALHSTIKFSLEENKEFMVTAVSGATTLDMQNEARALLWIQTSFGTLIRALDSFAGDPSLILTAAFFSGLEPDTGDRVLRLVAMNLDIFYYLKADYSLQIAIFDDKGQGHGTSKTPTFQQIIKVTKPQFYDEMVKLVHRLAVVGEVK
ncbi:MAG TPA: hypothetical protein VNJ08_08235 [Bacteriovoracaceae bacterium]|nr:hypothetical protein [Bacteriovoracaceae bacterium]